MTNDATTLVCLFHHQDQASAAVRDLSQEGLSKIINHDTWRRLPDRCHR